MSSLPAHPYVAPDRLLLSAQNGSDRRKRDRTIQIIYGRRQVLSFAAEIYHLRRQCGQSEDYTTDPRYFITANAQRDSRRLVVVLIRRHGELEACVFFIERCRFGLGLGLLRGGDDVGDGLVIGQQEQQLEYVQWATQELLQKWSMHGVSVTLRASLTRSIELFGPANRFRLFAATDIKHKLLLENTYADTLARMGPRTRRSLSTKRRQLETREHVLFWASLDLQRGLEAMLTLRRKSRPVRSIHFYRARFAMLRENPAFFCSGLSLPDGTWLSVVSGWRLQETTYIDLQLNNTRFRRESISAVMRAFMLEHEIAGKQKFITFVGGTSMLLKRYCCPIENGTDIFLTRPCFRAYLFQIFAPLLRPESLYERVLNRTDSQDAQKPQHN